MCWTWSRQNLSLWFWSSGLSYNEQLAAWSFIVNFVLFTFCNPDLYLCILITGFSEVSGWNNRYYTNSSFWETFNSWKSMLYSSMCPLFFLCFLCKLLSFKIISTNHLRMVLFLEIERKKIGLKYQFSKVSLRCRNKEGTYFLLDLEKKLPSQIDRGVGEDLTCSIFFSFLKYK